MVKDTTEYKGLNVALWKKLSFSKKYSKIRQAFFYVLTHPNCSGFQIKKETGIKFSVLNNMSNKYEMLIPSKVEEGNKVKKLYKINVHFLISVLDYFAESSYDAETKFLLMEYYEEILLRTYLPNPFNYEIFKKYGFEFGLLFGALKEWIGFIAEIRNELFYTKGSLYTKESLPEFEDLKKLSQYGLTMLAFVNDFLEKNKNLEIIIKKMDESLSDLGIKRGYQSLIIGSAIIQARIIISPKSKPEVQREVINNIKASIDKIKVDTSNFIQRTCKLEFQRNEIKETVRKWNYKIIEKSFQEFLYHRELLNRFLKKKDYVNAFKEFEICDEMADRFELVY